MSEQPRDDRHPGLTPVSPARGAEHDRDATAYVALLDHGAQCEACRSTPALCPEGQHLADALRAVRRDTRVVICCRCDQAIKPGEPYERHVHDRGTGAPLVNYSHRDGCPETATHPKPGR